MSLKALNSLFIMMVFTSGFTAWGADQAAISPSTGLRGGKPFDVVVTTSDGSANCKPPAALVPLGGSGIAVSNPRPEAPCSLVESVTIDPGSNPGVTSMQILDSSKAFIARLPFTIVDAVPGPVPPGIDPQVDVFWSVLSRKIVKDNFGGAINDKYYAIEVVIGNNSGYDLQLASIGFLMREVDGNLTQDDQNQFMRIPSNDYHIVRSTAEKQQSVGARAEILDGVQAASLLGIGISPYFRAVGAVKNYTTALNLVADPLERGLSLVWPDRTITELSKLDNVAMHDSVIISNNNQSRTIIFVDRRALAQRFTSAKSAASALKTPDAKAAVCTGVGSAAERACYAGQDDPMAVKYWLGNMVLVGNQIQYRQRIHITTNENKASATPLTITPDALTKAELTAGAQVSLKGDALNTLPATIASSVLTLTLQNASADGKTRTGTLKLISGQEVSPATPDTLAIPYGGATVSLTIHIIQLCGPSMLKTISQNEFKSSTGVTIPLTETPPDITMTPCSSADLTSAKLSPDPTIVKGYSFSWGCGTGTDPRCLIVKEQDANNPQSFTADTDHVDFTLSNGTPARLTRVTITP